MPGKRHRQQGAALVVVLSLLSMALLLGLSSMSGSLVNERLAGNYRAMAQAQMAAERAASEGWHTLLASTPAPSFDNHDLTSLIATHWSAFNTGLLVENQTACHFVSSVSCSYRYVSSGGRDYIIAMGVVQDEVEGVIATSEKIIIELESEAGSGAVFSSPIVGCEGVQLSGGSTIGSYDSRNGPWNGTSSGFRESETPLVRTLEGDGLISLRGNERIYGSVSSYGGVLLPSGSSRIHGNVSANGDVNLNAGGGEIYGNVSSQGNVRFGNSAKVHGEVKAVNDVVFENDSAFVGEAIYAGGNVRSTRKSNPAEHLSQNNRQNYYPGHDGGAVPVSGESCDNMRFSGRSISEEALRLSEEIPDVNESDGVPRNVQIGPWPYWDWEISEGGLSKLDKSNNSNKWTEHARSQIADGVLAREGYTSVVRVGNLDINQSGSLRVSGNVVLIVEGNFNVGGGGDGIRIDPGSSLTVIVREKTVFGSSVNMLGTNPVNNNGDASFTLLSTYNGSGRAVEFNGGSRVVANVYAPFGDVAIIRGANLHGSVRGKRVEVDGNGLIAYDEALQETGFDGEAGGGSGFAISSWR
ncbi:DUF7305 domain-containing protein [Billgrantia aerodenitrificans]|uniref:Polymer-forming cytoskeletal protein n=1 Tax=Billgrantia aerodenitrificans TaxID=2733483 RepID=A0ABS9AZD1_9GAMM|nr:polymer-forming cytoskeletal protein [Halomonas aerodenitrificans]MCE8026977.1 polymer-forming cytoskeletal protein [Halomonas aerodenitrificans]